MTGLRARTIGFRRAGELALIDRRGHTLIDRLIGSFAPRADRTAFSSRALQCCQPQQQQQKFRRKYPGRRGALDWTAPATPRGLPL